MVSIDNLYRLEQVILCAGLATVYYYIDFRGGGASGTFLDKKKKKSKPVSQYRYLRM